MRAETIIYMCILVAYIHWCVIVCWCCLGVWAVIEERGGVQARWWAGLGWLG